MQSLYLLIIFALMLTLLFIPLATLIGGSEEYSVTAWGIKSLTEQGGGYIVPNLYMGILTLLAALLPLVNIFFFKKRLLQMRLCLMEIVLLVGVQVYIGIYIIGSNNALSEADLAFSSMRYSAADVLPLICIILCILAFRGIARDHALIRSLDRIR